MKTIFYKDMINYLIIVMAFISLSFLITDVVVDFFSDEKSMHFYVEILSVIVIVFFTVNQIKTIYKTKKELHKTKTILHAMQNEISGYIDDKFIVWNFTKAETEVAWLIIKGFSPKEISTTRDVNERTINNQLSSIYKKSNTKNKHELLSSFLEDLMNLPLV